MLRTLCAGALALGLMTGAANAAGLFIIHHHVADYAKWKPVFDADKSNQEASGLTDAHVYRAADDANDITITFAMADAAKAKAFASAPGLKDKMMKAGVEGKPDFSYLEPAP